MMDNNLPEETIEKLVKAAEKEEERHFFDDSIEPEQGNQMDISKMSDQEKSDRLSKVAGIEKEHYEDIESIGPWPEDVVLIQWNAYPDLYDPANMAVVWRVLNWGYTQHDRMVVVIDGPDMPLAYWGWRINNLLWSAARMEADKATRHILDGIFDLAVNAGIVEEE